MLGETTIAHRTQRHLLLLCKCCYKEGNNDFNSNSNTSTSKTAVKLPRPRTLTTHHHLLICHPLSLETVSTTNSCTLLSNSSSSYNNKTTPRATNVPFIVTRPRRPLRTLPHCRRHPRLHPHKHHSITIEQHHSINSCNSSVNHLFIRHHHHLLHRPHRIQRVRLLFTTTITLMTRAIVTPPPTRTTSPQNGMNSPTTK